MHIGFGIHIKRRNVIREITRPYNILQSIHKQKVFCVGMNKTGTTSLELAMKELGYKVGNQREAELLFEDWLKRDFRKLIRYCKTAVFFQDSPFSHPYTYIIMDQKFPGSKFILTIRDSPDQWYNSLIRYHGKLWGNGNVPPTANDLKNAKYIYKGAPYKNIMRTFRVSDKEPYEKKVLIEYYNRHNQNVIDYFRFRQNDLLVLNVSEDNAYGKLTSFLGIESINQQFPWENRTNGK